jgi:hypothetical protein
MKAELPRPPAAGFGKQPLPIRELKGRWFRIYRNDLPNACALYFGRHASGRFDAPRRSFGVCYAAMAMSGAFIEVFGRNPHPRHPMRQVDPLELAARSIAVFSAAKLRLVDLAGDGLSKLGLTVSILATTKYETTRAWSQVFHAHPGKPDGILYRSRHDPEQLCIALFDRASKKLRVEADERLDGKNGMRLLAPALAKYNCGFAVRPQP